MQGSFFTCRYTCQMRLTNISPALDYDANRIFLALHSSHLSLSINFFCIPTFSLCNCLCARFHPIHLHFHRLRLLSFMHCLCTCLSYRQFLRIISSFLRWSLLFINILCSKLTNWRHRLRTFRKLQVYGHCLGSWSTFSQIHLLLDLLILLPLFLIFITFLCQC